MRILVTGATGFVGRVLVPTLVKQGHSVRSAVRAIDGRVSSLGEFVRVGEIDANTRWDDALQGIDVVIHAAARAHMLNDSAENADLYWRTNVDGTKAMLAAASNCGVKRVVYVSSIKVNGENTFGVPFTARDPPNPSDPYGKSKLAAEQAVLESGTASQIETVVVRPPLVYGEGVRANFLRLARWVQQGLPLPFGAVRNARSMVSVWNLCDFIHRLATVTNPAERIFLVSDGDDLSTPGLIRKIAEALGKPARLVSIPVSMMQAAGRLVGREGEVARLCGSLQVDISESRRLLDWAPPMTVDEGLRRTFPREGSALD